MGARGESGGSEMLVVRLGVSVGVAFEGSQSSVGSVLEGLEEITSFATVLNEEGTA